MCSHFELLEFVAMKWIEICHFVFGSVYEIKHVMRTMALCKKRLQLGRMETRPKGTHIHLCIHKIKKKTKNKLNVITVIQYAHHHFRSQETKAKHTQNIVKPQSCTTKLQTITATTTTSPNWTFIRKWWMNLNLGVFVFFLLHLCEIHKPTVSFIYLFLFNRRLCGTKLRASGCQLVQRIGIHIHRLM